MYGREVQNLLKKIAQKKMPKKYLDIQNIRENTVKTAFLISDHININLKKWSSLCFIFSSLGIICYC